MDRSKSNEILRGQRYAGDMVRNVRVTTKVAKSDNIRVNRKEWIIVENTHEGIVPKEMFFKVNEEILPLKERHGIPLRDNRRQEAIVPAVDVSSKNEYHDK